MQKTLSAFTFLLFLSLCSHAQFTRYIIKFKDKGSNPFTFSNPSQYLSQRALDRRARYNIAIDSTDLPVTPRYIDSLRLSGDVTILTVSKWLNQVAILTSDNNALIKINSFPFVASAAPIAARAASSNPVNKKLDIAPSNLSLPANNSTQSTGYYNYGQSADQVKIHNGDFLHNHGFRGEGMRMAVLDAGFYHYLTLPTFDSIRTNNQVLGTWDFVANELSVNEDYFHGMQCLSTIAANIPGTFVGTAPKTSFYLFRTEDVASEYPIEEQNWASGIEKADSLGVDITSTSLGYTQFDNALFDYTYADMNGNTTISARAADWAAKKGMLVVAAAGNEGNSTWHYLTTPSDADSALAVGAVSTTGQVANFSSYGPGSGGDIKPAVAAVGLNAVVADINTGLPSFNSGTSFACPNMAGIATCLWQAFPEVNNMDIISVLEAAASNSNSPNDRIGYGIPDVKKAFVLLQKRTFRKQTTVTDCNASFQLNIKADNTMGITVERKLETDLAYIPVATLQNSDNYGIHLFSYNDDLTNVSPGIINYRFRMNIASDSSFYLDSTTVNHSQFCNGIAPVNDVVIKQEQANTENIKIEISRVSPAKVNIVIQNAIGQKVYNSQFQQPAGTQTKTLALKNILASKGIYFISVFIDNKKVRTKEIIRP